MGVPSGNGFIVVMYKETECPLPVWSVDVLEVTLEAGNQLFKRLFT